MNDYELTLISYYFQYLNTLGSDLLMYNVLADDRLTDANVVDTFKFNLEELWYSDFNYPDVTKVNQFLRKQTNLKKFTGELGSGSVGVLLNELPNLKYVDLQTDVNELKIYRMNLNIIKLTTNRVDLLQYLPNLKFLTIPVSQLMKLNEILTAAKCYLQLKRLQITSNENCDPAEISVKIGNIKNIKICVTFNVCHNKTWLPFISSNDHIEELVFHCQIGNDELITILKTCKNLKSLDLAKSYKDNLTNLAEIINEFGSELEYLKITNSKTLIEDCKNIQSTKLKIWYKLN